MSLAGRLSRIAFLPLIPLMVAGCASRGAGDSAGTGIRPGSPCAASPAGEANRQAPIVCVDDSSRTLSVSPDPVTVHDALRGDRSAPVVLQWFTTSGTGDLQLDVDAGCVQDVKCDGNGHCTARTVPRAARSCKYDVWINGGNHDRLDPTIVISPCCG